MFYRNTLALNLIDSGDGDVEQKIHKMVFEKIYFVNVKKTAIRARQQSGFEPLHATTKGLLEVDGSANTILGSA